MSEQTIYEYNRRAPQYEKKWKNYLEHTHRAFLQHLKTDANDVILDASGGTGLLAEELLNGSYPFKELVVNDPSEGMRVIAENRLPDRERITFTGYRVDQLPFEDNWFDLILCLNAFHFYPEQEAVLDTFRRILKPGGRLCLLDWNRTGFFRIVNQIITWTFSGLINTRSFNELIEMLVKSGFRLNHSERWRWRYWKFLYLEGEKPERD